MYGLILRHLTAFIVIAIVAAGVVGGLIAAVWRFWDFIVGHKRPEWLKRLYAASLKMTAIPRWFFRVFVQHPATALEETELAFIEIIRKFKSRVFLVLVFLFAMIFVILCRKEPNWQLFAGVSGVVAALTPFLYMFVGARNKEWQMDHEIKMQALKTMSPNSSILQTVAQEVKGVVGDKMAGAPAPAADDTPPKGDL